MKRLLKFIFSLGEDKQCDWVFCEEPKVKGWHYCKNHMEIYKPGSI